jgi:hypothetical protein
LLRCLMAVPRCCERSWSLQKDSNRLNWRLVRMRAMATCGRRLGLSPCD